MEAFKNIRLILLNFIKQIHQCKIGFESFQWLMIQQSASDFPAEACHAEGWFLPFEDRELNWRMNQHGIYEQC